MDGWMYIERGATATAASAAGNLRTLLTYEHLLQAPPTASGILPTRGSRHLLANKPTYGRLVVLNQELNSATSEAFCCSKRACMAHSGPGPGTAGVTLEDLSRRITWPTVHIVA